MRIDVVDTERCVGCQSCMFACARINGDGGLGGSRIAVHSNGGMEHGFVVVVCRACEDPPCAKVCPTGAIRPRKKGGGVRIDDDKCIGCGNCRDACILGAIGWDEDRVKPVVCKYCGYCADYCPHGVIEFNRGEVARAAE